MRNEHRGRATYDKRHGGRSGCSRSGLPRSESCWGDPGVTISDALAEKNKQAVVVLSALKAQWDPATGYSDDSTQHRSSNGATGSRRHAPAENRRVSSPEQPERQVTRHTGRRSRHQRRGSSRGRCDSHRGGPTIGEFRSSAFVASTPVLPGESEVAVRSRLVTRFHEVGTRIYFTI